MAHQTSNMTAFVTTLSPEPEAHHNKPDEHSEEKEDKFDEDISLEEALSTL
jgi:hypothetical protein